MFKFPECNTFHGPPPFVIAGKIPDNMERTTTDFKAKDASKKMLTGSETAFGFEHNNKCRP